MFAGVEGRENHGCFARESYLVHLFGFGVRILTG